MPKMKTKRGAAKRFKTTGSGKVVRSKAFGSHILTSKTTKTKKTSEKIGCGGISQYAGHQEDAAL